MQQITSKELINNKDKSILIVDIRSHDNFEDWHIKDSQNIDVYKDIWDGNLDKVKQELSKLPKDKKIVTVCNAGITAQKASTLLESMGYDTLVLEKGMKGWNTLHQLVEVMNENDLLLKQIIRPGKGCLSYLIGSNSTKECFIVDPSQFIEEYIEITNKIGFKIKGVIDTHVHADHVSGAKQLSESLKVNYYVSKLDLNADIEFIDLNTIDELKIGDNTIKIIKTPGHTDGSISLLVNDKALLTADTLFLEGVGRPDLGRDKDEIKKGAKTLYSTLTKIKNLNNDLIILPAHFKEYDDFPIYQKLKEVVENNRPLQIDSEQEFADYILENLPNTPPNYEKIKDVNKNCTQLPREESEKLEFGPNRCASK